MDKMTSEQRPGRSERRRPALLEGRAFQQRGKQGKDLESGRYLVHLKIEEESSSLESKSKGKQDATGEVGEGGRVSSDNH